MFSYSLGNVEVWQVECAQHEPQENLECMDGGSSTLIITGICWYMGFQKQEISINNYTLYQYSVLSFVRLVVHYKITRILWVIKMPGIEQVQFVRERLLLETPDLPLLLVCSFTDLLRILLMSKSA